MDLRVRQLHSFLALARHLHYGRTARSLFMSQPTMTFQIRSLEESLGVRLFDRTRKVVTLTAAGETFRCYAQSVVDTLEQAQEHLHRDRRLTLTVSCGPRGQALLLPRVIAALSAQYPTFRLEVRQLTSAQKLDQLRSGELDALLMVSPPALPALQLDLLTARPLVAMLSRQHPLARQPSLPLRHLAELPLLIPRRVDCAERRLLLETILAGYGIVPTFEELPQSCSMQLAYAAAGKGLAVAARCTTLRRSGPVVVLALEPPAGEPALPRLPLYLAALAANPNPALAVFRQVVLDCARTRQPAVPRAAPAMLQPGLALSSTTKLYP